MRVERKVQPYEIGESWLIGAKTNLMGRFSPQVERIWLPPAALEGGLLVAECSDGPTSSRSGMKPSRARLVWHALETARGEVQQLPSGVIGIELRRLSPANWSHAVNHHLLQSLVVRAAFADLADRFVVVLPHLTPRYIVTLYREFGFEAVLTDLPAEGQVASFHEEPFSCHRAAMAELVRELVAPTEVGARLLAKNPELPTKVFISRKDTRRLANEADVAEFLAARGFQKVYPETLSIPDQFALFAHATDIVGIHGAGLGPLAYRPPGLPCAFVEIQTPGHMTDFFRFISHQVGVSWVGVRGRLWPELVQDAYDFTQPFKKHSLADFPVDLASLEVALDLAHKASTAH